MISDLIEGLLEIAADLIIDNLPVIADKCEDTLEKMAEEKKPEPKEKVDFE